ncbi:MAG: cupin domain-containing protein [Actinobacteria bacterium]|jgi:quercetin dioxygenase-like cupin family protein|nr:MAG: cupin domain-containing protein [Actinomycetota bacterium]
MPYVDANQLPESSVPRPFERKLKVVMAPQTHAEVKDFTLLFSTLAPRGGCTDSHSHEESGELMVVNSGEGKAWLAGEEYELKPGVVLYAPPHVEHRTMNVSDEPMHIICVFIPPAPEDYLDKNITAAERTRRDDGR